MKSIMIYDFKCSLTDFKKPNNVKDAYNGQISFMHIFNVRKKS